MKHKDKDNCLTLRGISQLDNCNFSHQTIMTYCHRPEFAGIVDNSDYITYIKKSDVEKFFELLGNFLSIRKNNGRRG